jgi:cell division protein FtsQ
MRLIPAISKRKKVTRRKPISRLKRRRIAVGVVVIAFGGGVGGAVWSAVETGWLERQVEIAENSVMTATAGAGLAVREVLVRGRQITARDDLIAALDIHSGMPILAIDMEEARQRVESLGWVKSATIARRLPDTIYLQVEERKALALWQHEGRVALIDRHGAVIQRRKLEGFAALPLVVGEDAPENAARLLDLLHTYPAVSGQVEAAVRVSGRRWNLRLRNGIDIRLPADDVATALDRLAEYQREHALFERDVIAVDLRVPDRLIVRVNGDAAKRARATGENT